MHGNFVVGSVLFLTGSVATAQEVMTLDQLTPIAQAAQSFQPRDQFDQPPPLPSVAGKRFSYLLPPLPGPPSRLNCSGHPRWDYDAGAGKLTFAWQSGFVLSKEFTANKGSVFPPGLMTAQHYSHIWIDSFTDVLPEIAASLS